MKPPTSARARAHTHTHSTPTHTRPRSFAWPSHPTCPIHPIICTTTGSSITPASPISIQPPPPPQAIVTSILIFPLAFSVNAAYMRRQHALINFASMKADLWALHGYHDYWLRELAAASYAQKVTADWDQASTRSHGVGDLGTAATRSPQHPSQNTCGVSAGAAGASPFGQPGDHDEVFDTMQSLLIGIRGCVSRSSRKFRRDFWPRPASRSLPFDAECSVPS